MKSGLMLLDLVVPTQEFCKLNFLRTRINLVCDICLYLETSILTDFCLSTQLDTFLTWINFFRQEVMTLKRVYQNGTDAMLSWGLNPKKLLELLVLIF